MLQPFDDWEVPMDKYICDVRLHLRPRGGRTGRRHRAGPRPSRIFPTTGYAPSAGVGKDDFSLYEG